LRKSRFSEEQIIKVLKEHAAALGGRCLLEVRDQRCDVVPVAIASAAIFPEFCGRMSLERLHCSPFPVDEEGRPGCWVAMFILR
jgi:hypothetical protein